MIRLRPVPSAPSVEYSPWHPSFWALVGVGAATLATAVGIVISAFWHPDPLARYEYHLWQWEASTLLNNAFTRLGIPPSPDDSDGLAAVQQYFLLTSQLRAANETANPNLNLVETLTNERGAFENDVERLIERYISEAVDSAGLQRRLPLFRSVSITWPPVDFELTSPPRLLIRSPRAAIRRRGDTLLRNDLTLRQIEAIESRTDDEDTVSLVIAIGGLAAYPAIVRDDRSLDSLLDTASHEWVHHYLAFYRLGRAWGDGGDAITLNETTANIAGREIAAVIQKLHPIRLPEGGDGRAPAAPAPTVDFNVEMHSLRLEVDDLLVRGRVSDAEAAMEAKRHYLAEHGIAIRKLNQAYFAFYGDYGDTPASSNPIGPKVERVWAATKDVGLFLHAMREVANARELDELVAALETGRP